MEISGNFLNRKKQFMEKLQIAKEKNEVDYDIIELLDLINSLPFAYTTSSCSGRIMLIDIPPSEKKFESFRLARWHYVVDYETFWNTIKNYKPKGVLWLKVDSFIIAFAVNSIEWAAYFLKLARLLGLKYSGIRSINIKGEYIILDVASTEHVHLPLSDRERGLLVDEEYAKYIYNIAISKLKKTKSRLRRFHRAIKLLKKLYEEGKVDPSNSDFKPFSELIQEQQVAENSD
ncbi:MAG: tRNA-wybutosine modification methyltransferase TYW3 [Candidatus Njordarchaeia archaeon]